ncbi:unnamed protein product [Urochloa decumbens]|uniref:BHLH domain-containing protein n=1 Tax=Urochloa decumbens TaxID=240449 RepID=A0ABC9CKL9_9POAL
MAQDGPRGDPRETASSGEHSFAPPPTVTFLGPTENNKGGSRIGSPVGTDATSKGKEAAPNAIQQGGEHGSVMSDVKPSIAKSKGKRSAAAGKVATTDAAGHGFPKAKGKGSLLAADEDGDVKAHILTERERRRKMKDLFGNLHALMPHIPDKIDKASLVGETIHFIRALEKTKAQLEKRKLEQAVARQAAAQAAAASSSSFLAPTLQTAQGMAAMSNGCWGPPAVPPQQRQPPAPLVAAAGPVGFQTWSAPNVVLSVMREKAAINLCVPRQPRVLTLVMSVLNKHGIDVVTAHVVADESARSMITVYTTVNGTGGENRSAEEIYKLAVSEIMVWLSSC